MTGMMIPPPPITFDELIPIKCHWAVRIMVLIKSCTYITDANVLRQCENAVQVEIDNELDIKVVSSDVTIDHILTIVSTFGSST